MTQTQKIIKYCAIALAVFLIFSIISGIASAIGIISTALIVSDKDDKITELNLSEDANVLDIDLKATNLTIVTASDLKAETDNEYITITNENNRLIIKEKKHNLFNQTNNKELTVYVPNDLVFDGVNINSGTGKIIVDKLNAQNLFLDLGAGNVNISNIFVSKKSEIDGGAGELSINNGNLNNLDLDLGVGDVNITSILTGSSEIDTGIGSTTLNILGSKEDYKLEVDKGIGKVTVDGLSVNDEYHYGKGTNKLDIDGGIGDINIMFKAN